MWTFFGAYAYIYTNVYSVFLVWNFQILIWYTPFNFKFFIAFNIVYMNPILLRTYGLSLNHIIPWSRP